MGRIVAQITIINPLDKTKSIECSALVDTGASHVVLPRAWKGKLGKLETEDLVEFETATQSVEKGEVCGPVRIQIEGFRPIHSEVLFTDMHPEDGAYEPLLGYIALEQAQAAVDMLGHRLVHVKRFDLK